MNGYTMLADRVASLLPNTTAGACVPASPWWEYRQVSRSNGHLHCDSSRTCHYSCHGAAVCPPWVVLGCG
jgi:hypothetical protein